MLKFKIKTGLNVAPGQGSKTSQSNFIHRALCMQSKQEKMFHRIKRKENSELETCSKEEDPPPHVCTQTLQSTEDGG